MPKITKVWADIIHDSRGDNTIQVTVETDTGHSGSAAIPTGASIGMFEAKTVEPARAVEVISTQIEPALKGLEVGNQADIDHRLIELDGTPDKSRLGANAMLGTSMATARVAAAQRNIALYRYIGELDNRQGFTIPIPMMNLINGGKHAHNNLDIQEFMIIPDRIGGYHNQLSAGKLIFSTLGQILRGDAVFLPTGDEGGYAPNLDTNEIALDYLLRAIKESGYQPWDEISLGLDVAASSLPPTFEVSTKRYLGLLRDFPILSIEDPFPEQRWDDWSEFKEKIEQSIATTKRILLVGDDLFATNPERLQEGIDMNVANAILIKLNQIGTVTETIWVAQRAREAGYITIVSHRSGETLDDFIADFSVGIGAQFIKAGAPNDLHPERLVKYRRLLTIEQEIMPHA